MSWSEATDALQSLQGDSITTSWGPPDKCLTVSGDVPHDDAFGGPDHTVAQLTIPERFASDETFLAYLKEFIAAQHFFAQIEEALGRTRE